MFKLTALNERILYHIIYAHLSFI